jgi:transglutaminase-like putative cysteine protease
MSAPVLDAPRPANGEVPVEPAWDPTALRRLAAGLLAVLAAAWAWQRVYPPLSLLVPALTGVLFGAAAVVLADQATRSALALRAPFRVLVGAAAALLAGLITAMTVAIPRATSPTQAVTDVIHAVTGGLARILTTTLPAPPGPDLLPQFAVLCALASAVTATIARFRGGLALAGPAACLLVTGLVCGVGGAGSPLWVTLPFVLTAGLLVLPRPSLLPVLVTGIVLALGCVAGLAAGGVARKPVDPRHLTPPPLEAEQPTAPMDEVAGWLRHSGDTAFRATVDSAWKQSPQPWRIATLDRYDGIRWTSSTPAVPVGYDLPKSGDGPADPKQAQVSVTPAGLDGVYVPVPGRVSYLARPGMTYDLRGETLVDPDGLDGSYHETVDLTGASAADRPGLERAAAGRAAPGDASMSLEGCADDRLAALAETAVTNAGQSPLDKAQALQRWFSNGSGLRLDTDATPGDSCARVLELFGTGNAAGHGTPDQFATAYVLMARGLGLPARVAVGFEAGRPDETGTVKVRFGTATAWPEIWFAGAGWVPFSATPDRTGKTNQPNEESTQKPVQQPEPPKDEAKAGQQPQEGTPKPVGSATSGPADRTPLIAGLAGVLTLLLLIPVVGALITVLRRRRRRSAGALGAWAELLDRLADLGHPSAGRTSSEIRSLLVPMVPGVERDVEGLAHEVDSEVYGGRPGNAAGEAWGHLRQIEKALKGESSWIRRVWRRVDPRPRRWA